MVLIHEDRPNCKSHNESPERFTPTTLKSQKTERREEGKEERGERERERKGKGDRKRQRER